MIALLLVVLGWCAAATALTAVLARVILVRDRRDRRGSAAAAPGGWRRPAPDDGVLLDLTALPNRTDPTPDLGPADLPRAG